MGSLAGSKGGLSVELKKILIQNKKASVKRKLDRDKSVKKGDK